MKSKPLTDLTDPTLIKTLRDHAARLSALEAVERGIDRVTSERIAAVEKTLAKLTDPTKT